MPTPLSFLNSIEEREVSQSQEDQVDCGNHNSEAPVTTWPKDFIRRKNQAPTSPLHTLDSNEGTTQRAIPEKDNPIEKLEEGKLPIALIKHT